MLVLEHSPHQAEQPVMLTEFGGIAMAEPSRRTWGYSRTRDAEELGQRYEELLSVVRELALLSGYCYTQFADTYQEANGLLYADRTPKFSLERMAAAACGPDNTRRASLDVDALVSEPARRPE